VSKGPAGVLRAPAGFILELPMVDTTSARYSKSPVSDLTAEADAPVIEVTEEMIDAGVRVLWESGRLETFMDGVDQLWVQEIFVAMSLVSKERSSR
jgi:hypothetical protein